jgi:hypothetical protein
VAGPIRRPEKARDRVPLARSGRKSLECRYVSPAFAATRHNLTSSARKSTCLTSLATECRPQTPCNCFLCNRLTDTQNLARLSSAYVTRPASSMCCALDTNLGHVLSPQHLRSHCWNDSSANKRNTGCLFRRYRYRSRRLPAHGPTTVEASKCSTSYHQTF